MLGSSSDLEFLNRTLSQPAQPRPSASTVPNDTDLPANPVDTNDASPLVDAAGLPADILKSLQSLSPEEQEAFAPLLHALSGSSTAENGAVKTATGHPISAQDVQDLLKQFDAADSVADTLEGKLDRLLESLEEVEDAFPETAGASGDVKRRPSHGEGGVGPQQLPETMAGEAKHAFEEVAKDRE
jgi:hypothetical protein